MTVVMFAVEDIQNSALTKVDLKLIIIMYKYINTLDDI